MKTLIVADEAPTLDDKYRAASEAWGDRTLYLGSPWDSHSRQERTMAVLRKDTKIVDDFKPIPFVCACGKPLHLFIVQTRVDLSEIPTPRPVPPAFMVGCPGCRKSPNYIAGLSHELGAMLMHDMANYGRFPTEDDIRSFPGRFVKTDEWLSRKERRTIPHGMIMIAEDALKLHPPELYMPEPDDCLTVDAIG